MRPSVMTGKERVTRAIEFRSPDRIPARVSCLPAVWQMYRDDLRRVYEQYDWLNDFGWRASSGRVGPIDYDAFDSIYREGDECTDNWGSVFHNAQGGLFGYVKGFPLENWNALRTYSAPDPTIYDETGGPIDWQAIQQGIARDRGQHYTLGSGDRLWERMHFLRGMERIMVDLAEGRPEVQELIDLIVDHNIRKTEKWLEYDVDGIHFGDDWGTQRALLISPAQWREYFKPAYAREFAVAKTAGKHTWMHSDGHILPIIPDLIEIGLDVVNPQVGANGLENLARVCKRRICVDLDLDRQGVLTFGTPTDVRKHIQEAIRILASEDGGLMFRVEFNPPAPLANIEACFQALAEYCEYPLSI